MTLIRHTRSAGWFESNTNEAVHAVTKSTTTAAVAAYQANPASGTAALYAKTAGTGLAGHFEGSVFIARDASVHGNVTVDGDLVLTGADVAEQFELSTDDLEPGSVVVLDDDGRLTTSRLEYDPRVAGIISGAGDRVPALVLDRVPAGGEFRWGCADVAPSGECCCGEGWVGPVGCAVLRCVSEFVRRSGGNTQPPVISCFAPATEARNDESCCGPIIVNASNRPYPISI